jgi:hypothetical protein
VVRVHHRPGIWERIRVEALNRLRMGYPRYQVVAIEHKTSIAEETRGSLASSHRYRCSRHQAMPKVGSTPARSIIDRARTGQTELLANA